MKSEYVNKFKNVRNLKGVRFGGDPASPGTDFLLIERIEDEEIKTKSGLVIAKAPDNFRMSDTEALRSHLGFIVYAGEHLKDDPRFAPGTIVLLNEYSIRWYTTFPGIDAYTEKKLGLTLSSEIKMSFESVEAFEAFREGLNSNAE